MYFIIFLWLCQFFWKISCKSVFFVLYYISVLYISRCSAVGSARGLGPWGRRFDPCHLDHFLPFFKGIYENLEKSKSYKLCYFSIKMKNSIIFLRSKKFYKICSFSSTKNFNKTFSSSKKASTNFNKKIFC